MRGSDSNRFRKGDETYSNSMPSRSYLSNKDFMAVTKSGLLSGATYFEKNWDPVAPPTERITETAYNNRRNEFVLSKFSQRSSLHFSLQVERFPSAPPQFLHRRRP